MQARFKLLHAHGWAPTLPRQTAKKMPPLPLSMAL